MSNKYIYKLFLILNISVNSMEKYIMGTLRNKFKTEDKIKLINLNNKKKGLESVINTLESHPNIVLTEKTNKLKKKVLESASNQDLREYLTAIKLPKEMIDDMIYRAEKIENGEFHKNIQETNLDNDYKQETNLDKSDYDFRKPLLIGGIFQVNNQIVNFIQDIKPININKSLEILEGINKNFENLEKNNINEKNIIMNNINENIKIINYYNKKNFNYKELIEFKNKMINILFGYKGFKPHIDYIKTKVDFFKVYKENKWINIFEEIVKDKDISLEHEDFYYDNKNLTRNIQKEFDILEKNIRSKEKELVSQINQLQDLEKKFTINK